MGGYEVRGTHAPFDNLDLPIARRFGACHRLKRTRRCRPDARQIRTWIRKQYALAGIYPFPYEQISATGFTRQPDTEAESAGFRAPVNLEESAPNQHETPSLAESAAHEFRSQRIEPF
jgi:hypothetical protein